jgi:hypothetical protein
VPSSPPLPRLGPLGPVTSLQAVVLGMHRSGTSALMGVLDRLGLYAGTDEELWGGDAYNPLGYWEHRAVYALHEELLAARGRSWKDLLGFDLAAIPREELQPFASRAAALAERFGRTGPWAIKDPRLCFLLPLWLPLLDNPVCVLIYRDPLAVARSLHHRDHLPLAVGLALWEQHNLAMLSVSRGLPRVIVSHRELLRDPAATARRLVRTLLDLGVPGAEALRELTAPEAEALVDADLERQRSTDGEAESNMTGSQARLWAELAGSTALQVEEPALPAGARDLLATSAATERELNRLRQVVQQLEEARSALAAAGARREAEHAAELAQAHRVTSELERRSHELAARNGDLVRQVALLEAELTAQGSARAALDRRLAAATSDAAVRAALLDAVFASRSWRLGASFGRALRRLRPGGGPSAEERWRTLRPDGDPADGDGDG